MAYTKEDVGRLLREKGEMIERGEVSLEECKRIMLGLKEILGDKIEFPKEVMDALEAI